MQKSFWQRRRRRIIVLSLLAIAVAWYNDLFSACLNKWAKSAIAIDHLDEAQRLLTTAELFSEKNPETSFLLARVARKQSRPDDFRDHLRAYVARGGLDAVAQAENLLAAASSGQAPELMGQLADLLVSQTADTDEVCYAFANGFLIANDLEQAFVLIHEWKQSFPEDPRPHYVNGRVQDHLSNQHGAEQEYRAALDRRPDHYPSAFALGRLLLQNNHPKEALEFFRRCRAMNYDAASRIEEAKCLRQIGDIEQAREILVEVTSLSVEQLRTAYDCVSEPLQGRPDLAELGSLLVSIGSAKDALPVLEEALKANPRDLDVRYMRGIALRETGSVEEGGKEIQSVSTSRQELSRADAIVDTIDLARPHVAERIEIGEIYLRNGSLKTAEFWLLSAVSHEPTNRRAHELLAELYTIWAEIDPQVEADRADAFRDRLKALDATANKSTLPDEAKK